MHNDSDSFVKTEDKGDGAVVLVPTGDIDMSRSPELRGAIRDAFGVNNINRLVIDLEGVGYMDSSGLATLVEAMRTAKTSGVALKLSSMSERVRALFDIAKLDRVFDIVETREAALGE